jgi:hypothetical protein
MTMALLFNKWFLLLSITLFANPAYKRGVDGQDLAYVPHPIHVSVTELNHNAAEKTLEISCKLFTDDFEKVLAQNYKTKVDLTNPPDKAQMEKLVNDYIHKHLSILADGQALTYTALGFEKDQDVVYSYFQVDNIKSVKNISITNTLMYDLFTDQIGVMHVTIGGTRKSGKVDYPAKELMLSF